MTVSLTNQLADFSIGKEMEVFLTKLEQHLIELKDLTLYHGTVRLDSWPWFLSDQAKAVYFSTIEQQSSLRPFNVSLGYQYPAGDHYPLVYRCQTKRPLKLLNLAIINDQHYLLGGQELVPLFEGDEWQIFDFIKEQETLLASCETSLSVCNKVILAMLAYFNQQLGTNFDGYYCYNDTGEVALTFHHYFDLFQTPEVKFFDLIETYYTYTGLELNRNLPAYHSRADELQLLLGQLSTEEGYRLYQEVIFQELMPQALVKYHNHLMVASNLFTLVYSPYQPITEKTSLFELARLTLL